MDEFWAGFAAAAAEQYEFTQEAGVDAIKYSDERSWNVALVTWLVVGRNDHVDTAEDDDGLAGIDEGCSTTMDDIGVLDTMQAAAILQSWIKDDYGGSNQ
ncbi:predicted protein [Lichtheimia corymbifera JMRC:FSU:9682]|uniref:Uncharacterized protein n=1 Tax=Lichtheimia corymbifera JMRC:FSU:9682 TaxID=1263082 RepID=A0A068SDC8_9FUNG|nr:predicted protein [Lichtheimia corymbifera JMRC:FSU:9682]